MREVRGVEEVLPAIRALLAEELVTAYGYRRRRAAELIGVTSAAVTQYLSRRRGSRLTDALKSSRETRILVSSLARRIADRERQGLSGHEVSELLDTAYHILSLLKGERALAEAPGEEALQPETRRWLDILGARLGSEMETARKCLDTADRVRDDFTKILFREIATDSLRHADILSHLIAHLKSGGEIPFEPPRIEVLEEMIAKEDGAAEQPLKDAVKVPHPPIRVLLESVDADEAKHLMMLKLLCEAVRKP